MKEDDDKTYNITNRALDMLNDQLEKEHKLVTYTIIAVAVCVCFFYLCYFISGVKTTKDTVTTIQKAIEVKEKQVND